MSSHAVHDRWVRNLAATAKCDWCSQKNLVLQRCGVCHINVCHDCMAKGVLEDNQHQVARTSVNDWNWHKGPRSQRSVQSCDLGNTGNILHHENSVPSAPFPQNSSWPQPPGPYGRAPTAFPVPGNIPYGYFGGPHMAFGPGGQPSRLPPPGFFQTPYTPGYYGVQERMPQGWVGPAASYPAWNRPFIGPGQTSSQSHAQQQPQQNSTKPSHAPNPFLVPEEPVLSLKRLRPQTPSDEGAVEEAGGRPPAIRRKSENTPRETVLSGKRSESHSAEAVSLSGKPFKTGLPEKKKPSKQTLSKQTLSKQILSKQTLSAEKESSDKLPENTSCVTEHHDKDDDQPDKHVKEAAGILVAMSQGVHQPKTGSAGRKARRSPSNAAAGKMPQAGPSASSSRQALPKSSSPAPGASAGPSVLSRGPAQTARSANSAIATTNHSAPRPSQPKDGEDDNDLLAHTSVFAAFSIDARILHERDEQGALTARGKALREIWPQVTSYLMTHFGNTQVAARSNRVHAAWSNMMAQMRDDTPGNAVNRALAMSVHQTVRMLLWEAVGYW